MKHLPEIATTLAILSGWALLTWPVAHLVSMWAIPISAGLLLLSAAGWKLLVVIAWEGLYALGSIAEGDLEGDE